MDRKFPSAPPDTLHYPKTTQEISIRLPRQHLKHLSILKFLLARKNVCLLPCTSRLMYMPSLKCQLLEEQTILAC